MADNYFEINGQEVIGIHSGSNANGSYVKLSDGTMMQWGIATGDEVSPGARMIKAFTFPVSFVNSDYTVTAVQYGSYNFIGGQYANIEVSNTNKNSFGIFFTQAANSAFTPKFSWIAVGRWK